MKTAPNLIVNGNVDVSTDYCFSISNNYRFDALLRAIDFFSQKFNLETLIDFSGDFINEILTLGHSAVFIYNKKDNSFSATKTRLYKNDLVKIPNSSELQSIATLHGTTITNKFNSFFTDEFLEVYKPALLIPLIHANTLLGFIITTGKAVGELSEDDFRMAEAIMHLFNNAFERNYYMEELDNYNKILNNKVFETVNKASKVLFSEISLNKLLIACIEIFSEICGSMNTAVGVLEETKNSVRIRAYADVKRNTPCPEGFYLDIVKSPKFEKDKYIYDLEEELDLLKQVFVAPEKLREFDTKYVVLIVREKILGFVTLGKGIKNGGRYYKETLELVNVLAISCFTALQNAMIFDEISQQKREAESKYNELIKLMR